MHLGEPLGRQLQAQRPNEPLTVLLHRSGVVTHMEPQIEADKGPLTDPILAGSGQGMNMGRSRPMGADQFHSS